MRPLGQVGHGLAGALDIGEAEGGQALGRGVGGEPGCQRAVTTGEGLEQGPEPEPLVDGPGGGAVGAEVGVELVEGVGGHLAAVPQDPGQAGPGRRRVGHHVDLVLVLELQAVLDPTEEAVGRPELVGVVEADIAGALQLDQGSQGGRGAQRRIEAAVDELEQLDGELDVPDPPGAPLDLPVGEAPPGHLGLGPALHVSDGADVVGVDRSGPQGVGRGGGPGPAEGVVTGDPAGLEQGLALPGLRPAPPVGGVGHDRPDQGTVATLRTQVGVHPEARSGQVQDPPGAPGQIVGVALADEEHVDVARVVELVAAELAHADDRQVLGPGQAHGRGQDVVAEAGQRGGGDRQRVAAGEVPGSDAQQFPVLPDQEGRPVLRGFVRSPLEVDQDVEGVADRRRGPGTGSGWRPPRPRGRRRRRAPVARPGPVGRRSVAPRRRRPGPVRRRSPPPQRAQRAGRSRRQRNRDGR